MAIPDFQTIMLPLLEVAGDGVQRSSKEIRAELAVKFDLDESELAELIPSGRAPVFANRVAWAIVFLQRAGLLERPKRAHYVITAEGISVVESKPDRVDVQYLQRYPSFAEWRNASNKAEKETADSEISVQTPEEILDTGYMRLREQLAVELLEQVKSSSPAFFERLVVELLVNMGYGGSIKDAGSAIGKSGDEGIDGIIKEDRLGLDIIYVQAKRWVGTVGRPEVQKFVGALHGRHARKGVFITTGSFAQSAVDYAVGIDPKVILIDGRRLAEFMIDYNVGVTTREIYEVKKIDSDYFVED